MSGTCTTYFLQINSILFTHHNYIAASVLSKGTLKVLKSQRNCVKFNKSPWKIPEKEFIFSDLQPPACNFSSNLSKRKLQNSLTQIISFLLISCEWLLIFAGDKKIRNQQLREVMEKKVSWKTKTLEISLGKTHMFLLLCVCFVVSQKQGQQTLNFFLNKENLLKPFDKHSQTFGYSNHY